jgi:hypothetical protein
MPDKKKKSFTNASEYVTIVYATAWSHTCSRNRIWYDSAQQYVNNSIPALSYWNCDPHSNTSDGLAGSKGRDMQLCCQIYCTKECFLEKRNQIAHFLAQNHKFTPVTSETRRGRGKCITFLTLASKIRSETTFSFQTSESCRVVLCVVVCIVMEEQGIESERQWLWPLLSYCISPFFGVTKKSRESQNRVAGYWVKNQTWTSQLWN